MVCLKDIKRLTKKKVLSLQPIYYVFYPMKISDREPEPRIFKLEGEKLEGALKTMLLYDDFRCFTTEEEALKYIEEDRR